MGAAQRSDVLSINGRRRDRSDTRQTIISCAKALLARDGYARMIIEDLAREAGIGKGSVYLHFRSKEEVVLAVVDTEVDAVLASLTLIAGANEPAGERLKAMVLHRVLDRFDRFRVFSSSLHDLLASLRPALLERRDAQLLREADAFARVLKDGIKSGEFIPMNVCQVASAILTSTNSLLPYYLSPRELGERATLQRRAGVIADLAYRAVRSRTTRRRDSKLSRAPRRALSNNLSVCRRNA